MLALRSERFARSVKESLTIQKCQVEFFVAMPVNMDIRANLTLTAVYVHVAVFRLLHIHIVIASFFFSYIFSITNKINTYAII